MTQNKLKTNIFSKTSRTNTLREDKSSSSSLPSRHGGSYPFTRLRRTRQAEWSRRIMAENTLNIGDLIWPAFVIEGNNSQEEIPTMPGVFRYTSDKLVDQAKQARELGLPAMAIFPVTPPELKTPDGAEAVNPANLVCRCVREIKKAVPDIGIIADVALDPYTDHGHDGLLEDGKILNDKTNEILVRQALAQAEAGVDVIAPSDMMDGRIGAIRSALEDNGFHDVMILSYAAKYASAFYGPFRDAVQSKGCLNGDKSTYQMDPPNAKEALREVELDIAEGADMVMIKPGQPYLDIIRDISNAFPVPIFAYQVSGEYTMLKNACDQGLFDFDKAVLETLTGFKRAGASGILSYFSLEAAKILQR